MSKEFDTDVIIVGYGPTGVTAANALGKLGVSTIAFERDKDIYPRARAVTVNDWTLRVFQAIGIDKPVLELIEPQRALHWVTYDGQEIMRQEHPPSTLGTPGAHRFYNIYQPTMESELRRQAERFGGLNAVRYGFEVTGIEQDADGVTVTATELASGTTTTVRGRYVIAADGGSSPARLLLGVHLLGDTVPTEWVVIDCRAKRWWPDRNLLTFWSDAKHPVVDIMLAGGNHRWEIPLEPHEAPADYPTQAELWPLLNRMGVTSDDVEIHQHAFYKHHLRMADRWRVGRVFLAGDAAHLMPPWAGAGMQSGMRDAWDISWKLAGVLKGELPEAVLDTYEAERRVNVDFYTRVAEHLGRVIKQQLTPEEQAAMAAELSAAQEMIARGETPPEAPLNAPPVLAGGWFTRPQGEDSAIGRMIPQPEVSTPRGVFGRLDDHLGHAFVLLGDRVDPRTLLTAEEKAGWDALGSRYLTVRPVDSASEGPDDLIDLDGVLAPWFERYGNRVVALRPDRFVLAADSSGLTVPPLPTAATAVEPDPTSVSSHA
ncbi:bifunctional 3-(3-hydroxy-phenyl)propionate/3-hydroxycinnamic acid hydroxylase [Georgenia thermotolerans]|uniref:Bifunctional 3-(3-hydroxy-phenyl)propionate/3-hydroxycinnamic acid hydroxylase n=1 Tax=Georgenia thermotolerans TaxID=527326 RepID=A0A7J5UTI3_9MICO|nr:bifunctional 3-(3-hydroxy-phenyl)propionate/3-hydroxycinnamic acid hydroxylase [Georgenia thermotolerans]KAE8765595.1 bifunctional 3-(3-hydroxy-phenyl)propionate/3-hydroxycinnamic acid hydroxylase [Georgenia thermotolerans]